METRILPTAPRLRRSFHCDAIKNVDIDVYCQQEVPFENQHPRGISQGAMAMIAQAELPFPALLS